MKVFFVLCISLLFLGIVISQYVQNEIDYYINDTKELKTEEKNQTSNENYFKISLRDYYYVNEIFNFNFSSIYHATFNILNSSMDYIAENINSNFILNLLPGDYYIEINIPELNYTNYTYFQILSPEIKVYPREIYVNENVFVFVKDYIGKNFSIIIEPEGKIFNFVKLNESEVFSFNFENEGNYTIFVDQNIYYVNVLKKKEYSFLNFSFADRDFFSNQNISFIINGSAYTSFNFSVISENIVVFQIKGITDQDGFYNGFVYFEMPGNYSVYFEYGEVKDIYSIEVKDMFNFNIYDFLENYERNVSFLIIGPPLADFYLYFYKETYTKTYYLRTGSSGLIYFEDIFENGEYNMSLVYKEKIVTSKSFFVGSKNNINEISGDNIIYKLDNDILSDDIGIFIVGNNILLDCGGHSIIGKNFAIFVENSKNVELKSCVIENSDIGLLISNSENITVSDFSTNDNSNGIIIKYSRNIKVINSNLTGNRFYGLLFFSVENPIVENTKVKTNTNFEILEKIKN